MELSLCLIGYPVAHSLSPWIHRQFLDKTKVKGTYTLNEIKPDEFDSKIKDLLLSEVEGFNVTVPYKQTIIPYLDSLDIQAEKIGAVNTVKKENGNWVGYNTDGLGYVESLRRAYPALFEKKSNTVLIIGAGGAARSIYFALNQLGFTQIDLANRTKERAHSLLEIQSKSTNTTILNLEQAQQMIGNYDLIIQTTNVGMKPDQTTSILSLDNVKTGSIVSDIVYQPILTNFLKEAQKIGASIHFGHTMLLYQAKLAFELWSDQKVSVDGMEDELKHILEG